MKGVMLAIAVFSLVIIGFFIFAIPEELDVVRERDEVAAVQESKPFEIPPAQVDIALPTYISQTFNNCSVAALAMTLSYYGVAISQEKLAEEIRPFNNLNGDNDDKSTIFPELERAAEALGLTAYWRPNGTIDLLKRFTAAGFPVIARTLTSANEDYLHFRVVTGYDTDTGEIIQDDSMQGRDLRYTYDAWNAIWQQFNYEYMVIAKTDEEQGEIEKILGEELDMRVAWQNSLERATREVEEQPGNLRAHMTLVVALFHTGDYESTVSEFEKIEARLPRYTLWYQMEPIEAYFELGNYERVLALSEKILEDRNRAVSELYILRGEVFLAQGDRAGAREEFEKAVYYNKSLPEAHKAFTSLNRQEE
jgi:tetratricopeptide (TPR) repeat protein